MGANDRQVGGSHYKQGGENQHWDLVNNHNIAYLEGCATKYVLRWRKKDGIRDLQKGLHFVDKRLECYKEPVGYAAHYDIMQFLNANDVTNPDERCFHHMLLGPHTRGQVAAARDILVRIIDFAMMEAAQRETQQQQ